MVDISYYVLNLKMYIHHQKLVILSILMIIKVLEIFTYHVDNNGINGI